YMTLPSSQNVTQWLRAWSNGDQASLEKLVPVVEAELHRLAERYLRQERPEHTLQATALVNEAYLRLMDDSNITWQNRAHFFGVAANLMRRILVDHARRRGYLKRGGGTLRVSLVEGDILSKVPDPDLGALDEALDILSAIDPRKSQIVELRF